MENSGIHLPLTQLADIAPFILKNMDLPVPHEMMK
jgi:bisphosphoglycerate-independent phosphoglycerate mutase (AlkP superfamily)